MLTYMYLSMGAATFSIIASAVSIWKACIVNKHKKEIESKISVLNKSIVSDQSGNITNYFLGPAQGY